MSADTVQFQWFTMNCCPVTAEAAGSSPVDPAISFQVLTRKWPLEAVDASTHNPTYTFIGLPPISLASDDSVLFLIFAVRLPLRHPYLTFQPSNVSPAKRQDFRRKRGQTGPLTGVRIFRRSIRIRLGRKVST